MFEQHYEQWLAQQRKLRKGESLRKLDEDHGHSEKLFLQELWWPVFGNLDFLHAEHEVPNSRNSSYYLDHAYIRPPHLIDWEVDDFSSYAKNINRRGFDYERDRQNHLMLDGWQIYRFSLDAIKERPRQCQQFILQVMGRLYGGIQQGSTPSLSLKQREIMRLALRLQRPFTPLEVCVQLGISNRSARDLLHELVVLDFLEIVDGHLRARTFRATYRARSLFLG
ncbi:DNA-binding response regulator [Cohnella silvisoli]|uniref:DNA-binding response regulator n=1 Tax=Cohnella silvisoli TaxID=2873699 RepID=A0ABV1KS69_9BACL|nr:DNA-binding response regulator [Cohnella silvisoli]MCD9024584.1 DNA-binding response regulator [Cohnella silvisoli]